MEARRDQGSSHSKHAVLRITSVALRPSSQTCRCNSGRTRRRCRTAESLRIAAQKQCSAEQCSAEQSSAEQCRAVQSSTERWRPARERHNPRPEAVNCTGLPLFYFYLFFFLLEHGGLSPIATLKHAQHKSCFVCLVTDVCCCCHVILSFACLKKSYRARAAAV